MKPAYLRPLLLALVAFALLPAGLVAAEDATPVRLVSTFSLSPDGKDVVFAWRDDIWMAPTAGGDARRLTFHPAAEGHPWVSPDGKRVAFVSNRTGSDQVFVMPIAGGTPEQVTTHTEGFVLYGWFPEGDALLVRARHDHHWRRPERFFRRSLDPIDPLELLFDAYGGSAALSPDGNTIAFVREGQAWWRKGYRGATAGQIWLYDRAAKTFTKLTDGDHGERWPQWSADGKTIWFSSQADGTFNLWRMNRDGTNRQQHTKYEDDGALFPRISKDGTTIILRRLFDLQILRPATQPRPKPVVIVHRGAPPVDETVRRTLTTATQVAFSDDAREIAFVAGGDIWVMDTELREPRQVTNTAAEERDPVFSPDFETLYFVSDFPDQPDVFAARREDEDAYWWQNEAFAFERLTNDPAPESGLRFVPGGERLAFVHGNGDLVTMQPDGADRQTLVTGWDKPYFDFSPDGKWVAWSVQDNDFNSDVWIQPVDGSQDAVNVSRHPDYDVRPVWSPDGKVLAFMGRRYEDEIDVYYVWLRREDEEVDSRDRTIEKALAKMKGRKKKQSEPPKADPAAGGTPAPDAEASKDEATKRGLVGSWAGRLTGEPPLPASGLTITFVVTKSDDGFLASLSVPGQMEISDVSIEFEPEAGTVAFDADTPMGPLSVKGQVDDAGTRIEGQWTIGDALEGDFVLERADAPPATEPKAEAGAKPSEPPAKKAEKKEVPDVVVDLDGIEDRIRRISIPNSDEEDLVWSADGKTLAFRANVKGQDGTYTVTFPDKLTPTLLSKTRGAGARWLKEGNQITWLSGGSPASLTSKGKATGYAFRVYQEVDLLAEHGAAFELAWRTMRDTFYDERLGNRDWDAVREKYLQMAQACATGAELEVVVNLMLGELNGSHLGFRSTARRWSAPGWRETTGHLGLVFDPSSKGPGLRVERVIERAPASEKEHQILVGEIVHAIDGRPVGPRTNVARVLTGLSERDVRVEVESAAGDRRTVVLRPTTYGAIRNLLYAEWLDETRAQVDELSGGTLGYLHVQGMNWSSFQKFEAELYKVGHKKDALIIDVRENGGGSTTDHLLTCLTQPRHAITVPRGGGQGYPQGRMVYASWDKPVIVLCNQNSFSNAEIFAHAIKSLGRGQVVGVPTAGGVISTGMTTVMGLGTLRLPFRGWYLGTTGEDMELNGCVPHHIVWPQPGELPAGKDRQLEKAVEVLIEDVQSWQARPRPNLVKSSER